jgi:hypothetical protein
MGCVVRNLEELREKNLEIKLQENYTQSFPGVVKATSKF